MEIQKILTGVLAKTLNLGDGEIAELIKDGEGVKESDIIQKILDLDVQRVEKIKTSVDGKEKFQEGYKKGKEEIEKIDPLRITAFDALQKLSDLKKILS